MTVQAKWRFPGLTSIIVQEFKFHSLYQISKKKQLVGQLFLTLIYIADIHHVQLSGKPCMLSSLDKFLNPSVTQGQSQSSTSKNSTDKPTHSVTVSATNKPNTSSSTVSVSNFVSKNDMLKAEILWTLHTITAHHSYKSNFGIGKLSVKCFQTLRLPKNLKKK